VGKYHTKRFQQLNLDIYRDISNPKRQPSGYPRALAGSIARAGDFAPDNIAVQLPYVYVAEVHLTVLRSLNVSNPASISAGHSASMALALSPSKLARALVIAMLSSLTMVPPQYNAVHTPKPTAAVQVGSAVATATGTRKSGGRRPLPIRRGNATP